MFRIRMPWRVACFGKRLVVTKMVGVVSANPFLGCFLIGQHLAREQGEALTLAGQGAFGLARPSLF
jgi:hypothetical protein